MARKQYNYRLAERLNWFEATRTPVNAYPLNVSVVGTKHATSVQRSMQRPYNELIVHIPEFRLQTGMEQKKGQ